MCGVYCDLSPGSVPEEACKRLFAVLRRSEDVASDRQRTAVAGAGVGTGTEAGAVAVAYEEEVIAGEPEPLTMGVGMGATVTVTEGAVPIEFLRRPEGAGEGALVRAVLLPDLRPDAEECEMTRALWERLHRAASGTFVC